MMNLSNKANMYMSLCARQQTYISNNYYITYYRMLVITISSWVVVLRLLFLFKKM